MQNVKIKNRRLAKEGGNGAATSVNLEALETLAEELWDIGQKTEKIVHVCCKVLLGCQAYLDEDFIKCLKDYSKLDVVNRTVGG